MTLLIRWLIRSITGLTLIAVCLPVFAGQSLVLMDKAALDKVKARVNAGQLNDSQTAVYDYLLARADHILQQPNPTVVNKTLLPPTQNKHDYLSISRYWWPDPAKEDGLPWIRKDGITNPDTQTDAVDRPRIGRMATGVKTLALGYYLSGKAEYADKAAGMLRTWFLDEATKMNPHLKFAQSVPGNPNSRRSGILDGRLIPEQVLDSITLLSDSEYWSEKDDAAMNQWLREYLDWLTQSKVGKQGAQQTNNHGSWYRFQVAALAYYLDDKALLSEAVEATKASLASQLDKSGGQSHELSRTRSFFYSCFNLKALTSVAVVAERAGTPFWDYTTSNNRSLELALDYLMPALTDPEAWPHPTAGIKQSDILAALIEAKHKYPDTQYATTFDQVLQSLTISAEHSNILQLILSRHPEYLLLE
ncbi:alginate lyase family protein [Gilvimarinus agarilyticus]|uniref:alginate lyase family protein n=1 Tax=Gilvimarinus sp. 2_MG-2023 TaxID=3062666 RepID=UPI001C09DE4D|nr:alginate lyase family protein [Gilvimarinus sp. 2_MG-2023]MBU2885053.1 alginate lyase family protein [Gilvimarinus agarilyticus]MDO6569950.1 alginate lyase family protein [Gilvimarinus sp. 2_MG-2023]